MKRAGTVWFVIAEAHGVGRARFSDGKNLNGRTHHEPAFKGWHHQPISIR